MKISIAPGDNLLSVELDDNITTRDLLTLLPLSLSFEDCARTEKIGMLPRKLAKEGAPPGTTPQSGDFCYYAPWGNLAIFLKPSRHSPGLIKLGRIAAGMDVVRVPGRMPARLDLTAR